MSRGGFRMLRCAMPGVEAVEAASRHSFARHTHDRFGIGMIHRGAQRSLSGRGTVEAGAGDVITVNPGEVHDGMPIGEGGRAWRILYFEPALVAHAGDEQTEGDGGSYEFASPVISGGGVGRRLAALFAALTTGAEALRGEELLPPLLATLGASMPARTDRAVPDRIAGARSRIDDDPAAPVTLAELARSCDLSRFQLIRAFTRATGLTPHAYQVQRRTDLARRLIAAGTPLAQAAADSGFADQSHMTRVFARRFGLSPGAYAQAVRG
ncbi:AraC family transcriptional regulator [Thalassobaculum sp.]|uniref:helix-turn-helix domain-containing protein n=1 Tax=Thalassobaculum sp. TaxID=2022740 RepID=UPI0032EC202B